MNLGQVQHHSSYGMPMVTMGMPGPTWGSTEPPQVRGTTHHTVPRVRDWHRLHHQIHPCCLPREMENMCIRGPEGRVTGGQDEHPTARRHVPSLSICVLDSLLVHESERTN